MQNELLTAYANIRADHDPCPHWSVRKTDEQTGLIATIPFVGKKYKSQDCKILIYGADEVLTPYDSDLDDDAIAINRHRKHYDEAVANGCTDHFPSVGIAPMDNGGLMIIAAYLYEKLGNTHDGSLCDFYEKIAFANYNKFYPEKYNIVDYSEVLLWSDPYVIKDIEILQPNIILIPKTIYQNDQEYIDSIKGNATIVPIYQIYPRTINFYIKDKYDKTVYDDLSDTLKAWYDLLKSDNTGYTRNHINGKTWDNFKAVFGYVDSVMR